MALPQLWGPGAKPFDGRVLHLPETIGYPRPLQAHVPILVGGGGERRTLRLAARHADGVNVMGDVDVVRRKVEVLHRHCDEAGRDPAEVAVTHLAPTLVGSDRGDLRDRIDRLRPARLDPATFAARSNAGTVDDQIGRVHELAGAGVDEVIVSLPDLGLDAIEASRPGRALRSGDRRVPLTGGSGQRACSSDEGDRVVDGLIRPVVVLTVPEHQPLPPPRIASKNACTSFVRKISSLVMLSMSTCACPSPAAASSSAARRGGSSMPIPVGMPPTPKTAARMLGIEATVGAPKIAPIENPT